MDRVVDTKPLQHNQPDMESLEDGGGRNSQFLQVKQGELLKSSSLPPRINRAGERQG